MIRGSYGNPQLAGNDLVGTAPHDGVQQFPFAWSQSGDAPAHLLALMFPGGRVLVMLQHVEHHFGQGLGGKRLFEKIHRPQFHRLDRILNRPARRDHDDRARQIAVACLQKLQPRLPRQDQVQKQTTERRRALRAGVGIHKRLRRRKRLHVEARALQRGLDEFAHRCVIVHYEYHAGVGHLGFSEGSYPGFPIGTMVVNRRQPSGVVYRLGSGPSSVLTPSDLCPRQVNPNHARIRGRKGVDGAGCGRCGTATNAGLMGTGTTSRAGWPVRRTPGVRRCRTGPRGARMHTRNRRPRGDASSLHPATLPAGDASVALCFAFRLSLLPLFRLLADPADFATIADPGLTHANCGSQGCWGGGLKATRASSWL